LQNEVYAEAVHGMMASPPERDLSISLFAKHLVSPMFLAPIG